MVRRCHNPAVFSNPPAMTNKTGTAIPVARQYRRQLGVGRHRAATKQPTDSDTKTITDATLCATPCQVACP
jgi:hypothetical protein